MRRIACCVATGSFAPGLVRLGVEMARFGEQLRGWNLLPFGSPSHEAVPYAFKAYALKTLADEGFEMLLWCDASVIPIRPLKSMWEQVERDGYWISRNGWDNSDWTCDAAYQDLFPGMALDQARAVNQQIPHVVGTAFALDIRHPAGRSFLVEYFRLASETKAFCGPWQNSAAEGMAHVNVGKRAALCGPPTTRGHRHDQTAMSVIAWQLGLTLTDGPHVFSYALRDHLGKPNLDPAAYADDTVLLAVGV